MGWLLSMEISPNTEHEALVMLPTETYSEKKKANERASWTTVIKTIVQGDKSMKIRVLW